MRLRNRRYKQTYDSSCRQHRVVGQVVNNIELEVITLKAQLISIEGCQAALQKANTMFPVIRGEGKTPFTSTAAREKPSGEMSPLVTVRSAVGPIPPATR